MILLYAGSQPDAEDRVDPRFPQETEKDVKVRIRGLLQSLKPKLVYGALAAGADIIFAEAAREEGIPFKALLPFDIDTFCATSVSSNGERWVSRYDRLISEVEYECLNTEVLDESYIKHNIAMLDEASRIAEESGERLWCVVIRPTLDESSPESVTDDMAARAEGRGLLTLDINPVATRARTFVVMPYGKKYDQVVKRNIDCDAVFHRVYRPLLEDLDLEWNRADLATDSGVIHVGMIDDLANSQLVLADLTATNFNVAYELGLRHVFARKSTVLVSPRVTGYKASIPPFDIGPIRAHRFDRSLDLTDEEAERAIKVLKPVLAAAVKNASLDSPVHEWFDVDAIAPPFLRRSAHEAIRKEITLRNEVQDAIRSSAVESILVASEAVAIATIDEATRAALRIELAVALLGESEYPEALALLEVAEPDRESPLHRQWLHQIVMALRRNAEIPDGGDYDLLIGRAEQLLTLALQLGYEDSESYGIWGGLLKRKILRGGLSAIEAAATFERMRDLYGLGFRSDPHAYTGINYVMALRIQARRNEASPDQLGDLNEALVVTRFLNNIDLERDPLDPWALITDAELQLHDALWHGHSVTAAGAAYTKATYVASAYVLISALDQLNFLVNSGDDPHLINAIIAIVTGEGRRS